MFIYLEANYYEPTVSQSEDVRLSESHDLFKSFGEVVQKLVIVLFSLHIFFNRGESVSNDGQKDTHQTYIHNQDKREEEYWTQRRLSILNSHKIKAAQCKCEHRFCRTHNVTVGNHRVAKQQETSCSECPEVKQERDAEYFQIFRGVLYRFAEHTHFLVEL